MKALKSLERFMYWQRLLRLKPIPEDIIQHEDDFFAMARAAFTECNEPDLRRIENEISGLEWYFGSYCWRVGKLDQLKDRLLRRIKQAIESKKADPPN